MTMTTSDSAPRSVSVHIASANEGVFNGTQAKRRHIQSVFRTFVLAAATPVPILAEDRSRVATWLVAYSNSVVLCSSESQAQDPANQVASALGAAWANTPANPQGTLLYVPVLVGPPTNSNPSVRWTMSTTEVVWAVSMAPAVLALTIENRAEGY
jgi:hypothetical protein